MKKGIIVLWSCIVLMILFAGADVRRGEINAGDIGKKNCGYTIIEAGYGVDCYGDTIKLRKIHAREQH